MKDPLAVYLHDHLAGATFAVELLEKLQKEYPDHETGHFARAVLTEIREDVQTLEHIVDQVGRSRADLKDAMAWLGEKASRAKLRHDNPAGIGAFEAMEALALGIKGKLLLWNALLLLAPIDARLGGINYESLAARAEDQLRRVEEYRLKLAPGAFVRYPVVA